MDSMIGAFDAKTHFSELLQRAEQGESITITRHGTPVARLVPIAAVSDTQRRAEAIARWKERRKRYTLGGLDWKALRDEGRK